jgi:polysaccharide export outer membrane protein
MTDAPDASWMTRAAGRLTRRLGAALLGLGLTLLLWAGCATPPQPGSPKYKEIILREGDVLAITFPGSTNLDTVQAIRRDGMISLPLLGDVSAVDLTPAEFQDKVVKLFEPQVATRSVLVSVQSAAYPIFVTGAVLRPGKMLISEPMTVIDAILDGGGVDYQRANLHKVRVVRHVDGKTERFVLDLQLVMDGKNTKPFYVRPDDIIFVPEKFTWF